MALGLGQRRSAGFRFRLIGGVFPPEALAAEMDDLGASPPDRWLRRRSVLLVVHGRSEPGLDEALARGQERERLCPPPSLAGEPVGGLRVRLLGEGQHLPWPDPEPA